jgi:hypothetical protein
MLLIEATTWVLLGLLIAGFHVFWVRPGHYALLAVGATAGFLGGFLGRAMHDWHSGVEGYSRIALVGAAALAQLALVLVHLLARRKTPGAPTQV